MNGGLAQLARAPRWQRGGHRFESDILHNQNHSKRVVFLLARKEVQACLCFKKRQ